MTAKEKSCFVITPIGHEGTETRRRSEQVFTYIIQPACANTGYKAIRADQMSDPGVITTQIIHQIVESPLVIADLSERNPNVFYELAVRHTIRKPYIQIVQKGDSLPFDVSGVRTIIFDYKDLESANQAKELIQEYIRSCEDKPAVDSPISVAVDLAALRLSDKPQERQLAEMHDAIAQIGSIMIGIQEKLKEPGQLVPLQHLIKVVKEVSASNARLDPISLLNYEEAFLALDKGAMLLDKDLDSVPKETAVSARAQIVLATKVLEQMLAESGISPALVDRLLERRKSRQAARLVLGG